MRPRISIRGIVRSSVGPLVGPFVRHAFFCGKKRTNYEKQTNSRTLTYHQTSTPLSIRSLQKGLHVCWSIGVLVRLAIT